MKGARQRWVVLLGLLTLAITAAAWVRDSERPGEADVVEPPVRPQRTAPEDSSVASTDRVALYKLRAHALQSGTGDPFGPRAWRKPEPTAAPMPVVARAEVAATPTAPPPPQPTAPPLPYVYLGKIASEETNAVFLMQGDRNLIVHAGDVVDQTYRVDRVADTSLTFTHLPTGIQQTLPIGVSR